MEVVWLEGAVADLTEIFAFIASRDPGAAQRVAATLRRTASRLDVHPNRGRKGRVAGTRELVVPRLPFVIAYRVGAGRVEIVRVVHGRRDWQWAYDQGS